MLQLRSALALGSVLDWWFVVGVVTGQDSPEVGSLYVPRCLTRRGQRAKGSAGCAA